MSDRLTSAVERARSVLGFFATESVAKGIWGSPAGKTHLARRIVAEIPEHRIYVEPFAGGGQVLFSKEPSEVEVVSDLDPEIAFAFKFAKNVTPEQLERLRRLKWVGDKDHFRKLYESRPPSDDVGRFYRFAYLVRFSFNKLRRGTMPDKNVGVEARFVEKLERQAPRLEKVRVRCGDYEKVIDEYDGPDTFFFLDPPYAGYDADCRVGAGHKDWDEERFAKVLRKIRGRFLCTCSADPFLAVMDGVLVQATSNVVDAAANPISKDLLRDMLKTLPSEHLRDKKAMRFLTSVDADLDYRNTLAERATAVGDKFLEGDTPVLYSGVPVQPVPLFPENLGVSNDQTAILLCNPKNIHVGIWRQIRVESARDISEGTLKIVATLRFDTKFAEEPGICKSINVQL